MDIEIIPNWHPVFVHFTIGLLTTNRKPKEKTHEETFTDYVDVIYFRSRNGG